jgi:hypothetical protein
MLADPKLVILESLSTVVPQDVRSVGPDCDVWQVGNVLQRSNTDCGALSTHVRISDSPKYTDLWSRLKCITLSVPCTTVNY